MGGLPTLVTITFLLMLTSGSHGLRTQRESNAFISPGSSITERTQAIAVCRGQAVTVNIWPDVSSVTELIGNSTEKAGTATHRGQCAYVISSKDLDWPFVTFTYSMQGLQQQMISPVAKFSDKFPWLLTLYGVNIEDSREVICTVMNGASQVLKTIFKFSATDMQSPLFLSTQITMKPTLRNSIMGVECTVTPPVFAGHPPVLLALRGPYGELIENGRLPTLSSSLPDGYLAGRYSCGLEGPALTCMSPPSAVSQRTTSVRIESTLPKPFIDHPAFLVGRQHGRLNCSVMLNQFAAADLGSSHPLVWDIKGVSQNTPGRIRQWRLIPEGRVGVLIYVSELYLGTVGADHMEQNLTCIARVGQQTTASFWVAQVVFPPLMPSIVGPESVLRGDVSQFKCITEGASLVSPTMTWSDNSGRNLQKMTRTSFVTYQDDKSQRKASRLGRRKRKSARCADYQDRVTRGQFLWSDCLSVLAANGFFQDSGSSTAEVSIDHGRDNSKLPPTRRPIFSPLRGSARGRNNLNNGANLQIVPEFVANVQPDVLAPDKTTRDLHGVYKQSVKSLRWNFTKIKAERKVNLQNTKKKRAISGTTAHSSRKTVFDESIPEITEGVMLKDGTSFTLKKMKNVSRPANTHPKSGQNVPPTFLKSQATQRKRKVPADRDLKKAWTAGRKVSQIEKTNAEENRAVEKREVRVAVVVANKKQENSGRKDCSSATNEEKVQRKSDFQKKVKRGDPKPDKRTNVSASNADTLDGAVIPTLRNDATGESQDEKSGELSGEYSDASDLFAKLFQKEKRAKSPQSTLSENNGQREKSGLVEDLEFADLKSDTIHRATTLYRVVSVIDFLPPPEVQEAELQCIVQHVSLPEKLISTKRVYVADPPYKPVIRGPHQVVPGEKARWTCLTGGPSSTPPSLRWSDDQARDLTSLSSTSSATYYGVDGRIWHNVTSVLTYAPAKHAHTVKLRCTATFAVISVSVSDVTTITVKVNTSGNSTRPSQTASEGATSQQRAAGDELSDRVWPANASLSQLPQEEDEAAGSALLQEPHPDKHGYMGLRSPSNAVGESQDRQQPGADGDSSWQSSDIAEENQRKQSFTDSVSIHSPTPLGDQNYSNGSRYKVFTEPESMEAEEGVSSQGRRTVSDTQSKESRVSANGNSGAGSRQNEAAWDGGAKAASHANGDFSGKTSENLRNKDETSSAAPQWDDSETEKARMLQPAASNHSNSANALSENGGPNAKKSKSNLDLEGQGRSPGVPSNQTSSLKVTGSSASGPIKARKQGQFRNSPSGVRINSATPSPPPPTTSRTHTGPSNLTQRAQAGITQRQGNASAGSRSNLTEWWSDDDFPDGLASAGGISNLTRGARQLGAQSQGYESQKQSEGLSMHDKMMFAAGFASVFLALILFALFVLWFQGRRGPPDPTDGY